MSKRKRKPVRPAGDAAPREVSPEDMERLARLVDEFLPIGHGFIVFAFPMGDAEDGRLRYVSNAKREDAVACLKEWMIQRGFDEEWMRHHD